MTLTRRFYEICRLCLRYIKDDSQTLIDTYFLRPENISLKNVITICMPEIDLDKTIQRHVCGACLMKLRGIYNYKCKVLTTEEQIVKYFHDNKVPSRTKLDLNCLIKEDKQIDDIALNIDNTYESLVSLIDRSKSESNSNSMCFYKETVYKCFMCDFASINYTSLTDHYKDIHHKHVEIVIEDIPQEKEKEKEERKYICEYPGCTYSSAAPYGIASHKTFHLRNFACGKCGLRHGNIQAAARHIASHNEANIAVKCALCGFKTANMSVARKHYFTVHKDCDVVAECDLKFDKNGNDCDIKTLCDDLSMMLDSFDTDKLGEEILSLNTSKSSQKQAEVFACKQCPYSTDDPTSLTSHERSAHNKKRRRDSNTSVETSESGKTLRSNSSLGKKTRSATEPKKATTENSGELEGLLKCKFKSCTYTTNNELSLRNHKNSAHSRLAQQRTKVNMKPKLVSNMKMNVKVMKKKLPVDKKTTPADKKSSDAKEKNEELKTDKNKEKKSTAGSATKTPESQKVSVKKDDKADKSKSKKASAKHIFGCLYCDSSFAALDKFNEHFSNNHSEKTLYFKCGLCNSKSLFRHKLKQHHKEAHDIKWKPVAKVVDNKGKPQAVENKEGKKKTTKRKIYVVENKNRPGYGRLRCPHCSYVTENYKYFITHWLIHSKPFSCAYCGHIAAEVRTVKNHVQSQHPGCPFRVRCAFKNCTFESADSTLSGQHFTEMHKDTKEHLQEFFDDYHYIRKRINRKCSVRKIKNSDVSVASTKEEDTVANSTAATESDHEEEDPKENNERGNTPPPVLTKEEPIKLEYDHHEPRFKAEPVVENNFDEDQNDTDRAESPLLDVVNHSDPLAEQNDDPDTYNCPHCTEKFLSLEDLDNHSKTHDHESHEDGQVPPIKCCFCSFEASDKAELRKHYVSDHNSKEGKEIDFNKEDGEDVTKEKVKEELVTSNIPEGSENEIIEIPDDVFSEEADELMENEVHNSSETQPQEDVLHCNMCGFSSNNKESMVSHKKIHAANPFVCVKCDQSFGESSQLKEHLLSHEKEQEDSTKPVEAEDDDSDQLKHDDLLATVKYSCEKCSFRTVDDEKMRLHHQRCKRKLAYKERQMRVVHKNVDPYEKKMTSYKTIINRDINEEDKRDGKQSPDDVNSSQNSSDQENEREVNDLNDSIVCLDEPVEDTSNTNDAVEKLREAMELEENKTNENEHGASVAPVQMVDPFESDSEDYCKTLEEAIASIDVPRPMVVPKNESDESAIIDNSEKMEFMEETATAPKISFMEDLVVIDDDDD